MEYIKKPNQKHLFTVDEIRDNFLDTTQFVYEGITCGYTRVVNMALEQNCECPSCKLPIAYFALEKRNSNRNNQYRLRPYGIVDGEPVLFNVDHIISQALQGSGDSKNLQLTCIECNQKKADKIDLFKYEKFEKAMTFFSEQLLEHKILITPKEISDYSLQEKIEQLKNELNTTLAKPSELPENNKEKRILEPFLSDCKDGLLEKIKQRIDDGENPMQTSWGGDNALHFAIVSKNEELCNFLLDNYSFPQINNEETSHLHVACRREMWGLVERLLDLGYDLHAVSKKGSTPTGCANATKNKHVFTEIIKIRKKTAFS